MSNSQLELITGVLKLSNAPLEVIERVAAELATKNKYFDTQKFITACGG